MSIYDDRMFSSDNNAYRSRGLVLIASLTMTGTVAGGAEYTETTPVFQSSNLDFYQILFDNSVLHPDKYRDLSLESATYVHDATNNIELSAFFNTKISAGGSQMRVTATLFNPSASPIALQDTTINFRFVPYDSTLL